MNTNQRGKFKVGIFDIQDNPEKVARFMQGMIVIRAQANFDMMIEYIALAPYFMEVKEGCEPPEYAFTESEGKFFLLDKGGNKV